MDSSWAARLASLAPCAVTRERLLEGALDQAQRLLAAPIGMIVCAQPREPREASARAGLRATHFEAYLLHWQRHDPTWRTALEHCAAVRDTDVHARAACSAFHAGFSERLGAQAYLVAPLYSHDGGSVGTLHLWRRRDAPMFTEADRVQATAFAALLSMILARTTLAVIPAQRLAPREHQVARLAVNGHTNRAIASQLGVAPETVKQTLRRVFRKVSVASRTELAAHYARRGWL